MKELIMLIRPEKLEDIKKILDDVNCGGMTLSTVMGCGTQKGVLAEGGETVNEIKGFKTTINLLPKVKVEVVVDDKNVEKIIEEVRKDLCDRPCRRRKNFYQGCAGCNPNPDR